MTYTLYGLSLKVGVRRPHSPPFIILITNNEIYGGTRTFLSPNFLITQC